jgi:hypothetical protein
MKLDKHILISIERNTINSGPNPIITFHIKLKVVEGFFRNEIKKALSVKDKWDPVGKDKLYFFPGCNVPRFKVREKFACTIKPENATAAFVSKSTMIGSNTTFIHYSNVFPIDLVQSTLFMNVLKEEHINQLFLSILANNNIESINVCQSLWDQYYYVDEYTKDSTSFRDYVITPRSRYNWRYKCQASEYQLLTINKKNNLDKMTCDIYFEETLLIHLNENNLIINKEKYNELRSFGTANDKENLVLMMELMSNCDFKESIVYLLFLLKEFGSSLTPLKESSHVNFKSLLSFLKLEKKKYSQIDIHQMTIILRHHKKFTRENAQIISQLFSHDYIDYDNQDEEIWMSGPILRPDMSSILDQMSNI